MGNGRVAEGSTPMVETYFLWAARLVLVLLEIASCSLLIYFATTGGTPATKRQILFAAIGIVVGTAGLAYSALHPPKHPYYQPVPDPK